MRLFNANYSTSVSATLLLAAMFAGSAMAQPTITNLGVLPGGSTPYSYANAISADGMVVAGYSSSSGGTRAFRWTAAGGMQNLGALTGFNAASYANAISPDGTVVTGVSAAPGLSMSRAFRWTGATGMQSIGVLGTGSASYGLACSGDGSVIAGGSYDSGFAGGTAFRWTSATNMQRLVPLPGGNGAIARAITPDGAVVAGTSLDDESYFRAFRWTFSGGLHELDILPGADSAEAYAISADGSAMAGQSGDQFNLTYFHAVRWTGLPGSSQIQDLGVLGDSDFSYAYAISADGSAVVGTSTLPDGGHAFLWTSSLGMVDLNTFLPALGLDLTGWTLASAQGISADGSAIVGYGTFNGADRAFLVKGSVPWPQCSPHWMAGPGSPGTDALISGLGIITGGDVFVSGSFNTAGGLASARLARYSPSNNTWSAVGSDADARAFVTLSGGDMIAGGNFTNIAGVPANYIARYSMSTNTWSPLGVGTNGSVSAITALPGGDLIMGGLFNAAGGAPFNRIARYNPVTGAWSALGSGVLGLIDAQALVPGGDLFVGGQMGGVGNISRYNFATNTWSALGSGVNGQVTALAVIPGGDLIVGGSFSVAGGVTRKAVARYRPVTNAWSTLGTGLAGGTSGSPLSVHALLTLPSGDVLVTGSFNSAGGVPASNIALYNPTSNSWSALGAGLTSAASIVFGLLQLPGGDVIVGGQFDHAGGTAANNIARYSFGAASGTGDGNADGAIDGLDIQGMVNSLVLGGSAITGYCAYDMNHDGLVNDADLPLFVNVLFPN